MIKKKRKNILKITLISLAAMVCLSGISVFIILHHYINKMNLSPNSVSRTADQEASGDVSKADIPSMRIIEDTMKVSDGEAADVSAEDLTPQNSALEGELNSDGETSNGETSTIDAESISEDTEQIQALEDSITANLENKEPIKEDKQVINILLIGTDNRADEKHGRSDSMILLSVNKEQKTILATSFLRDIYLKIPGKGSNRLNAAYAFGGAELLMDTLEQNFKIKIDSYIMADFFAFVTIVDTIGGIPIEISKEELPSLNNVIKATNGILGEEKNSNLISEAGIQLLNGNQALSYSRNRNTKKGDFDRTERQRSVLSAIFEEVLDLNLLELNDLLNALLPQVTTNMTEGDIITHFLSVPSYSNYDLEQLSIPKAGTYSNLTVGGKAVLGIDFEVNIREVQQKLYD